MKKIKQALISVSNKDNLKYLIRSLKKFNINLISSGGTYKEIKRLGFGCEEVSKYTNSSEILSGRVKTLHPKNTCRNIIQERFKITPKRFRKI